MRRSLHDQKRHSLVGIDYMEAVSSLLPVEVMGRFFGGPVRMAPVFRLFAKGMRRGQSGFSSLNDTPIFIKGFSTPCTRENQLILIHYL